MFSFSQPGPASAQLMPPVNSGYASGMDDVALGCECADPALQIPMWGLEAEPAEPCATAA